MGFLDKLASLFSGSGPREQDVYRTVVRCNRCGEELPLRVDLRNDLSIQYAQGNDPTTYTCRKLVSGDGSNLCFQKMEVTLQFDENRRLLNREVAGGTFVEPPED